MLTPPTPRRRVRRTTHSNGLLVLTEEMPHVRTAAFAVLCRQGSRDERPFEQGLSHFLEHFLFRGTRPRRPGQPGRTGPEIAAESDLLGGEIDAFTHRESTCYSAEVVADLLPRAITLISDLVGRPALRAADLERERAVVKEEIRGYEESVPEHVNEMALDLFWPRHPLGRPIEGTLRSVDAFTPSRVRAFWRRRHAGGNLIACAAGNLRHAEVVAAVREGLGELPGGAPPAGPRAPRPARGIKVMRRAYLEQAHVIVGMPGLPSAHPDSWTLSILVAALGGSLSSRLWMRIRELEGLAYDLGFTHASYRDAGRLALSSMTGPEHVRRLLDIFEEETARIAREDVAADEFDRARHYVRGGMILGLETPAARLSELAGSELTFGRHVPLEEHLRRLDAVTPRRVRELAARLLKDDRRSLVVMGPRDTPAITSRMLGPRPDRR